MPSFPIFQSGNRLRGILRPMVVSIGVATGIVERCESLMVFHNGIDEPREALRLADPTHRNLPLTHPKKSLRSAAHPGHRIGP